MLAAPAHNILLKSLKALLSLLNSMLESYQRLQNFTLYEKEFLITSNTEKLILNNQAKETALFEIEKMEVERLHLIIEVCKLLSLPYDTDGDLKLLKLAAILESKNLKDQSQQLQKIHDSLIKIIDEIRKQNQENAIYANSAIQSLNGAIESFKEIFAGSKTYEKKGIYRNGNRQSGNFIRKEI